MGSCFHECPIDDSEEYVTVSVTINTTVWRDVLSQLFTLVDIKRITPNCKLVAFNPNGGLSYIEKVFRIRRASLWPSVGNIDFERVTIPNESNTAWPFKIENIRIQSNSSGCKYESFQLSTLNSSYNTHLDNTDSTVDFAGELRLYY